MASMTGERRKREIKGSKGRRDALNWQQSRTTLSSHLDVLCSKQQQAKARSESARAHTHPLLSASLLTCFASDGARYLFSFIFLPRFFWPLSSSSLRWVLNKNSPCLAWPWISSFPSSFSPSSLTGVVTTRNLGTSSSGFHLCKMKLSSILATITLAIVSGEAVTNAKIVVRRDPNQKRGDQLALKRPSASQHYSSKGAADTSASHSHGYLDQGFIPPLDWIRGDHDGANETCSKVGREGYHHFSQHVLPAALKTDPGADRLEKQAVNSPKEYEAEEETKSDAVTVDKTKGAKPAEVGSQALNDSVYYSPPFYPTPQTTGAGTGLNSGWKSATDKARALLKQFTLEEKVALVTGAGWELGDKPRCVGTISPNKRVGFPGLCLEDSPLGVRFADGVTVWPAGVTTAATFSSKLAYERGKAMGEEFRAKGVNIALGPGMNMGESHL